MLGGASNLDGSCRRYAQRLVGIVTSRGVLMRRRRTLLTGFGVIMLMVLA